MSQFLTPLKVQALDDSTWQLTDPLIYQSDVAGRTFSVPPGFVTDFASVPRIPFVFDAFGDTSHQAAVIHDFIYSADPHPVDRATADSVLREAGIASGVSRWRAWCMWLGVRLGGSSHWA